MTLSHSLFPLIVADTYIVKIQIKLDKWNLCKMAHHLIIFKAKILNQSSNFGLKKPSFKLNCT